MSQNFTTTQSNNRQSSQFDNASPQRRNQPNPSVLRFLRGAMVVVGSAILLVGMLLIVLPMFYVSSIEVVGVSYYSEEEIVEASGIKIGDEMLMLDREAVGNEIFEKLPYVNGVKIRRVFNTVKITIEENTNLMYTEFVGKYYVLNREFRVLNAVEDEAELQGFLRVELPEISSIGVGFKIRFENEALDTQYITELLESLENGNVLSRVTLVDASRKYDVSYVMDGCCRVELGKVGDMSLKLTLVDEILARRGDTDGTVQSVVNVSDLSKPTYRVLI